MDPLHERSELRVFNQAIPQFSKILAASLYTISVFASHISYSSYDIPRKENAHENTLPHAAYKHNCLRTTFIMSGSAQSVFTSM